MKKEKFKYLYSFRYNDKQYIYLVSKNYPFYFLEYNSSILFSKSFGNKDIMIVRTLLSLIRTPGASRMFIPSDLPAATTELRSPPRTAHIFCRFFAITIYTSSSFSSPLRLSLHVWKQGRVLRHRFHEKVVLVVIHT